MAWENTLLDASFRGVAFDVQKTDDSLEKSLSIFEVPYVDGAEVDDMGNKPLRLSLSAIFFGGDYEARLNNFLAALETPGAGELVHPVWNKIHAQVVSYKVGHSAEEPDSAQVQVEFIEAGLLNGILVFNASTPRQSAEAIDNLAAQAKDSSALAFLRAVNKKLAQYTSYADRLALRDTFAAVTAEIRRLSPRTVLSGISALDAPTAFIGDIRGALDSLLDFPTLESFGISGWQRQRDSVAVLSAAAISRPPAPAGQAALALASDALLRERSIRLAQQAGETLALETDAPLLNPIGIETVNDDARSQLAAAIVSARSLHTLEDHHAISTDLKAIAWQVQDAAHQVLSVRPPLVTRVVHADCNLRLLAHWWYGDHERAAELLRLNPQIRNPNFIHAGDMLNGFAR